MALGRGDRHTCRLMAGGGVTQKHLQAPQWEVKQTHLQAPWWGCGYNKPHVPVASLPGLRYTCDHTALNAGSSMHGRHSFPPGRR